MNQLKVVDPEPGSFIPLRKMYQNPDQLVHFTIGLLQYRLMEEVAKHEWKFVIMDNPKT